MEGAVNHISERLAELSDDHAAVVGDDLLCELLDPLRGKGPLRVLCGRQGCRETVSWWGLPARGVPLGMAPILVDGPQGQYPMVSPNTPETRPETGYVYGVGPWIVEGARVIYSAVGPKPQYRKRKPPRWARPQGPEPYNYWSVVWLFTHENPLDADAEGHGLRLTFHCEKCGYRRTLTNTTMLKQVVAALAAGHDKTTL